MHILYALYLNDGLGRDIIKAQDHPFERGAFSPLHRPSPFLKLDPSRVEASRVASLSQVEGRRQTVEKHPLPLLFSLSFYSPFSILLHHFFTLFPAFPSPPLKVRPWIPARRSGRAL